ncbi:MAG: serine O-acetyltransferase, partial [Porticoccaceae bacterium]
MQTNDPLWDIIVAEAQQASQEEPVLEDFLRTAILDQADLHSAMSFNLAQQLASPIMAADTVAEVIAEALATDSSIGAAIRGDITACFERDAACDRHLTPI